MNLTEALRYAAKIEATAADYHKDYSLWAKHFGVGGYSEEPEEYQAAKYGLEDTDSFHNAIVANPAEATTALVFADHLDEQGQEDKAAVVRRHADQFKTSGVVHELNPSYPEEGSEVILTNPPGVPKGHLRLTLSDFTKGGKHSIGWTNVLPESEAKEAYDKLKQGGARAFDWVDSDVEDLGEVPTHSDTPPEHHRSLEKALRYVQETHADFHNRILENPAETTPALVYADWLQEQGKEAHAELIRNSVAETGNGGTDYANWIHSNNPIVSHFSHSPSSDRAYVTLRMRTPAGNRELNWGTGWMAPHQAQKIHQALIAEGAKEWAGGMQVPADKDPQGIHPTYGEPQEAVSEHFSADKPIRYSAVPSHEIHADYAPTGVAPRIGHLLGQLATEDTDAGALAEGILRTGSHDVLPILADRLDETGHPLAQEIDWRHAPRAIRIDRALHREIGKRQVRHPDGHRVPLSAGWVIADIEDGVQRPAFSRRKALFHARLAQPDATGEDVAHSLFRLLYDRAAQEDPSMGTAIPEYQRELTKARLQRLGHRPTDPFRYTDLRAEGHRKYKAEKVRYSHQAFQEALAKNPNDHTASAVYADWLDDQNLPTHAEVVRRVAEAQRNGGGYFNGGHQWLAGNGAWGSKGDFAIGVNVPYGMANKPEWTLDLASRHLTEAPSGIQVKPIFTLLGLHRDELKRLVDGLDTEGADMGELEAPNASPEHRAILDEVRAERAKKTKGEPAEPTYADTKKYAAYKAPEGGMVVKQSPLAVSGQWAEGGEFVNDLEKLPTDSVDYKKEKRRKKHLVVEYLRKRMRRVSGGTYTGSTLPETPSEGGGEGGE